MKPIFVDTSALIALASRRDTFHKAAQKIRRELVQSRRRFVTTNAVILEVGGYFSRSDWRSTAVKLINDIYNSKTWQCYGIDDELIKRGFELYQKMADKDWSLVDCISIVVAKDLKITTVFTADHHFEQAGLQILLQS